MTAEIARGICQRHDLKAFIVGSLAPLGSHYVITLEALNGQTGDALAREQAEAANKEHVLHALSLATAQLREKLGESLSSIQRSDRPLEQVATANLEAFNAWSLGIENSYQCRLMDALPLYQRAVELDPNFAHAHSILAIVYWETDQPERAAQAAERGYALRDRVSEYEKLRITNFYYGLTTGNLNKRLDVLLLLKRLYPREHTTPTDLSQTYRYLGNIEQAAAEARESIRLHAHFAPAHAYLGRALLRLNQFDEARNFIAQSLQQKLDSPHLHAMLYQLAFINGDARGMQQQLDWARGKPNEYIAFDWQTGTAAFAGQWRKAQDFSHRAIELAALGLLS